MHVNKTITRGLTDLFLIVATGLVLYPTIYMVLGAFTTPDRLLDTILLPIPNTLNLDFIVVWWNYGLWQAYVFTLGRCVFYIVLGLFAGLFGGYVFSKLRFPGRDKLFLLILSGMLMPAMILIVPMYVMVISAAAAGLSSGPYTRKMMVIRPAPSILAESSYSVGSMS